MLTRGAAAQQGLKLNQHCYHHSRRGSSGLAPVFDRPRGGEAEWVSYDPRFERRNQQGQPVSYRRPLLLGAALVGLLGTALLNVAVAVLARQVPDRPLSARLNPLNILAHRGLWTPEIRIANRWAVRAMLLFVASVVASLGPAFVELGRL